MVIYLYARVPDAVYEVCSEICKIFSSSVVQSNRSTHCTDQKESTDRHFYSHCQLLSRSLFLFSLDILFLFKCLWNEIFSHNFFIVLERSVEIVI